MTATGKIIGQSTQFLTYPQFRLDRHQQKITLSDTIANSTVRRDGRVVECAGLEIRYTARSYRGFKSLSLRHFYFYFDIKIDIESENFGWRKD